MNLNLHHYLLTLTGWFALSGASIAGTYYVSTAGSDTAAGTLAAPWRTIQKASNVSKPGDTVNIRGGVYKELVQIAVSGSATARITFQSYVGEVAVLDGTGLTLPQGDVALIHLTDRNYITLQGLELRNLITTNDQVAPIGILIDRSGLGLQIRNCKVHDIQQNNPTLYDDYANGHGLAAYGSSATAISGLVIDSCELYNLHTGASESLVLNGNVTSFVVSNNLIHDCNNIGIDFIGYEGTNSNATLDRANNGQCVGNKVWNITSVKNPAYGGSLTKGGGTAAADGIYVDGGTRITIERNEVWNTDIGVELASEHSGRVTDYVTVRNNVIRQNIVTGISLGGYAKNVGGTDNCLVQNNTVVLNDTAFTYSGQIQLQYNLTNCYLKNNIVQASPDTRQMIVNSTKVSLGTSNVIDYNLYYGTTASATNLEFDLMNKSYTTLAKWQATGYDAHSLFALPGFASPSTNKYDLISGSAAIDKGDPKYVPAAGELDFNAHARLVGKAADLGAIEYGAK